MSLLRIIRAQLGLSDTAAENHFWDGSVASILKLKKGTPDAPGVDVMAVDAAGKVTFPQNTLVGFTGTFPGSGISLSGIIPFTVGRNEGGYFNGSRFTPLVAGYYNISVSGGFSIPSMAYCGVDILFNGAIARRQVQPPYNITGGMASNSAVLYFNGITDYVEFWYTASPAGGTLTAQTYCSGSLIQRV